MLVPIVFHFVTDIWKTEPTPHTRLMPQHMRFAHSCNRMRLHAWRQKTFVWDVWCAMLQCCHGVAPTPNGGLRRAPRVDSCMDYRQHSHLQAETWLKKPEPYKVYTACVFWIGRTPDGLHYRNYQKVYSLFGNVFYRISTTVLTTLDWLTASRQSMTIILMRQATWLCGLQRMNASRFPAGHVADHCHA